MHWHHFLSSSCRNSSLNGQKELKNDNILLNLTLNLVEKTANNRNSQTSPGLTLSRPPNRPEEHSDHPSCNFLFSNPFSYSPPTPLQPLSISSPKKAGAGEGRGWRGVGGEQEIALIFSILRKLKKYPFSIPQKLFGRKFWKIKIIGYFCQQKLRCPKNGKCLCFRRWDDH